MKLVIDIPEEDYIFVKKQIADGITNPLKICIANGTPLPKGHGDLIDRDKFHQTLENICIRDNDKWFNWLQKACLRLAEAPTIIEADKTESEG